MVSWRLILVDFWPNIQHDAGVDNIVSDTLFKLPSASAKIYKPMTGNDQCCMYKLFKVGRELKKGIVSH